MSTKKHREEFKSAIQRKDFPKIRELLEHDDAKELLLTKSGIGFLPIHDACYHNIDSASLQLMIDAAVEHDIISKMLEEKDDQGWTCLHLATLNHVSTDSLRLLLEYLSKHVDMKKMLEAKDDDGWTCLHHAGYAKLPTDSLRLLLEYSSKYADIQKILEEKDSIGWTCLHAACARSLSTDVLRLLLEYLAKHADIKKMLEETDSEGWTCLHYACSYCASADCLRLLISFFAAEDLCTRALVAEDRTCNTPVDYTNINNANQFLVDRDCWQKCRSWLFSNHQDTFLYSLFPTSFDNTCQALLELNNGLSHSQQHATIILIALMSSASEFRKAIDKADSSAPMSSYFDVVKKGDKKSDYDLWRKNIHLFREFYGQWPPSDRKTASSYEGEGSSSCSIQ